MCVVVCVCVCVCVARVAAAGVVRAAADALPAYPWLNLPQP